MKGVKWFGIAKKKKKMEFFQTTNTAYTLRRLIKELLAQII